MNITDLENEYGKVKITKTKNGEAVVISFPRDGLKNAGDKNERETIAPPKF